MDQKISDYIENLINRVANLTPQQRENLRERFYDVILDTTIDNLTEEQIQKLQNIPESSSQMEESLQEFSSTLPNLAFEIEKRLNEEYEKIKQNSLTL